MVLKDNYISLMEGGIFQMGDSNYLRPLIKAPVQVDYSNVSGYKNEFIAIKWKDGIWKNEIDNSDDTSAEFFYNICYIDNAGKYHELGSSKVMLEILQDYFQYIGNIDGNGDESKVISFEGD